MRYININCDNGISGDMLAGALIGLGADRRGLLSAIESLGLTGYKIKITDKESDGAPATDFLVELDSEHENHDHDMEYLYGHLDGRGEHHEKSRELDKYHPHEIHHECDGHHDHEHHHHHHHHATLDEVTKIINGSALSDGAKKIALRVFDILAEGEAKAHGETKESVHFHEVGAVDSIIDICTCAFCIDSLGIGGAYIPSISEGKGTVRCAHGILDIPVPAVRAIADKYALPIKITEKRGEYVTPTGAALAAALISDNAISDMILVKKAAGTGKRAYENPSVLRVALFGTK